MRQLLDRLPEPLLFPFGKGAALIEYGIAFLSLSELARFLGAPHMTDLGFIIGAAATVLGCAIIACEF